MHKALLTKTAIVITETSGKQHVRRALDHFELYQGDRNYYFLIHEPFGATLQLFLDISCGSLPIDHVQDLTYQMLRASELIHGAHWQVLHGGPTSFTALRYLIHSLALGLQPKNILLRIGDSAVFKDAEENESKHPSLDRSSRKVTELTVHSPQSAS